MVSTSKKGDSLRDDVFKLLVAAKKENVTTEKNISGKNSDVYYLEKDAIPNRKKRIVAECKNYSNMLTRKNIGEIYQTYDPVKQNFDHLIIITTNGLSPGVQQTVDDKDWITHLTFLEFCHILLGFGRYVESIKAGFSHQGLEKYYVPPNALDGLDMESKVTDWVRSDSKQPLAVLAGYGMGKTSFARRLAFKYAVDVDGSKLNRIPLYIELGGIYAEQDIEGLICKHCTTRNPVDGFNYDLFLEFNRQGLLLIILDGFDEMKHAMSHEDFLYNFEQINSLVEGLSKIIVLGRPSAFMSDNEKRTVLHGYDDMDGIEIKNADKKDYLELDVASFDRRQLEDFVEKYFRYVSAEGHLEHSINLTDEFIENRKIEILNPEYSELIGRPVHARMLITIALSTEEPLAAFSRYTLYKQFIKLFLQRENLKSARRKTSIKDRNTFLQRVAWESWVVNEGKSISVKSISKLLHDIHETEDTENVLRELLTGSVLEPKGDDIFYFVHRSFQEFLAAQHLIQSNWNATNLNTLNRSINKEILKFVAESNEAKSFSIKILEIIGSYKGSLSINLLNFFGKHAYSNTKFKLTDISEATDPWTILLMAINIEISVFSEDQKLWFDTFNNLHIDNAQMAFLLGICIALENSSNKMDMQNFANIIVSLLHYRCEDWIKHKHANRKAQKALKNINEWNWAYALLDSLEAKTNKNEVLSFNLDCAQLGYSLIRQLSPEVEIADYPKFTILTISTPFVSSVSYIQYSVSVEERINLQKIRGMLLSQIREFWLADPQADNLVPIRSVVKSEDKRTVLGLGKKNQN